MSHVSTKLRFVSLAYGLSFAIVLTVVIWLSLLLSSSRVQAEPAENRGAEDVVADNGTTASKDDNEAASIAREILEIQEELGGSVVDQKFPAEPSQEPAPGTTEWRSLATSGTSGPVPSPQVVALRETAWQLEGAAHRLETLDLYEQADSLRRLGHQIRLESRQRREAQLAQSD